MEDHIDRALNSFLAFAALTGVAAVVFIAAVFVATVFEGQDARNDRHERAVAECHARGGTARVTSYGSLEACTIPPRLRHE